MNAISTNPPIPSAISAAIMNGPNTIVAPKEAASVQTAATFARGLIAPWSLHSRMDGPKRG